MKKRVTSSSTRRSSKGTIRSYNHEPTEELYFGMGQSSLGFVLVASSVTGVVAVLIAEEPDGLLEDLQERFPEAHLAHGGQDSKDVVESVIAYIEDPSTDLDIPLDLRGTEFQRRVWQVLRKIPMGKTSTYSEVAKKIGSPKAVRAVGTVCSTSPVAVIIPCHRVLHKDGSMSGGDYWGNDRQRILLEREAAVRASRRLTMR